MHQKKTADMQPEEFIPRFMAPPSTRYQRAIKHTIFMVILSLMPLCLSAQIWECSGQYTNTTAGKSGCQPAGGIKSCGSDGNRYFSPRRSDESPAGASCASGQSARSPFVDMSQKQLSQFGASGLHERLVAPARGAEVAKKRAAQPLTGNAAPDTIEDLFSCFSNTDKLKSCGPQYLGRFVEQTFTRASKALQQ